eukprot:COSAG01_NODE_43691_length_427_cov_0.905488_2_plen_27_part_01
MSASSLLPGATPHSELSEVGVKPRSST